MSSFDFDFSYLNLMQYYWLFILNDGVVELSKAEDLIEHVVGSDAGCIRELSESDQRRLFEWFQKLYGDIDG